MVGHVGSRIMVVIFSWAFLILDIIFRSLALNGQSIIFKNTTAVHNENFQTQITPAPFTYHIWIVIYIAQGIFLSYAFASLLRPSGPGYLYTTPDYLHSSMYVTYCVSLVTSLVWTFLWDNEQIDAALAFRLLSAIFAHISLAISMHALFTRQKLLVSYGHPKEYIWVIAVVHNPLGLYAMWLTIEALVNLTTVLVYSVGVHQSASGSMSLVFLTGLLVFFSLVDLAFFERYFRYLYAPMLALIWAFIGILVGSLDWSTSNTVFTLGLLIISSIVLFIKVGLSIARSLRMPLFRRSTLMGNMAIGNGTTTVATPPAQSAPVVVVPATTAFTGYPSLP